MTALDTKALEAAAQAAFEAGWPNERERQEQMERNPDTLVGYRKIIGPAVRAYFSALSPSQGEGPAAEVVEAQIEHMVQRFLGWKLPEHFRPDGGISYEPIANKGTKFEFERTPYGTNLFDHTQATAMVRYMFDGMPAALASLAPQAAQEAPADEQLGETSHVADDGQPDEAQEWHDYDPDC